MIIDKMDKIGKCFEELSDVQIEILDMEGIDFETRARIVNKIQEKKSRIMNIFLDTEKEKEPAKIVLDTEDDDNGQ
nr:MAG TPA: hypothetical protein [Caudoviricetes sp.]